MWESAIERLKEETAVIRQAPYSFVIVLAAIGALIWAAFDWRYAGVIDALKGTVGDRDSIILLRDAEIADYKRRLANTGIETDAIANPEEISDEDFTLLIQRLAAHPSSVAIQINLGPNEVPILAQRIGDAFDAAGWKIAVTTGTIIPAPDKIKIQSFKDGGISTEANTIANAFREIGIPFDLVRDDTISGEFAVKLAM